MLMESFILRIYRRDKNELNNIIGTIEDVDVGGARPFHNAEEIAGKDAAAALSVCRIHA